MMMPPLAVHCREGECVPTDVGTSVVVYNKKRGKKGYSAIPIDRGGSRRVKRKAKRQYLRGPVSRSQETK